MTDHKANGRIPQEDLDLAAQNAREKNRTIAEDNLSTVRERLEHYIKLLAENIDHIGAFAIVMIAKQDDTLVDPYDAEDPTTDAISNATSYFKGHSLLLAHLLKAHVRTLESNDSSSRHLPSSFPNFLAGLLESEDPRED